MKKMLRQKLTLSRETVTALQDVGGGIVFTNGDCSSDCFANSNKDFVC